MNDRIQEIKNRHDYDKALYAPKVLMSPPYKDRAYLLSEVERLQTENDRLMKEAAFWNQAADNQRDNNYLLLKDRAIMKGALEWYGNEENYEEGQLLQDPECGDYYNDPPKVIVDQGRCARTALSHLKG